jgi:hypothetical protein
MLPRVASESPVVEDAEWAFGNGEVATPWYSTPVTRAIIETAYRQAETTTLWVRTASGRVIQLVADKAITTPAEMAKWLRFHVEGGR